MSNKENFDFSKVPDGSVSGDAVQKLPLGELKAAAKRFPGVSLTNVENGTFADSIENMQFLVWAALKGQGCSFEDVDLLTMEDFSRIIETNDDE